MGIEEVGYVQNAPDRYIVNDWFGGEWHTYQSWWSPILPTIYILEESLQEASRLFSLLNRPIRVVRTDGDSGFFEPVIIVEEDGGVTWA